MYAPVKGGGGCPRTTPRGTRFKQGRPCAGAHSVWWGGHFQPIRSEDGLLAALQEDCIPTANAGLIVPGTFCHLSPIWQESPGKGPVSHRMTHPDKGEMGIRQGRMILLILGRLHPESSWAIFNLFICICIFERFY